MNGIDGWTSFDQFYNEEPSEFTRPECYCPHCTSQGAVAIDESCIHYPNR